jgi:hypothetical protein
MRDSYRDQLTKAADRLVNEAAIAYQFLHVVECFVGGPNSVHCSMKSQIGLISTTNLPRYPRQGREAVVLWPLSPRG